MYLSFKNYSLKVTVLTIALSVAGVLLTNYSTLQFSSFPLIIVLFYTTSLTLFFFYNKISNRRIQRFIPLMMLISGGKLLFYAFSLVIFLLFFKTQVLPIAATFACCYLSFSLLEVYSVVKGIS